MHPFAVRYEECRLAKVASQYAVRYSTSMEPRGIYRERNGWGDQHSARVKYDEHQELDMSESRYRERGYKPPFDELPWKDDTDNGVRRCFRAVLLQNYCFPCHSRQCVGFTSIRSLVSVLIQLPRIGRHGNTKACGPSRSMTANSRSRSNGAVDTGFHSILKLSSATDPVA